MCAVNIVDGSKPAHTRRVIPAVHMGKCAAQCRLGNAAMNRESLGCTAVFGSELQAVGAGGKTSKTWEIS